jgi:predicted nuclease with TOPRIM domain
MSTVDLSSFTTLSDFAEETGANTASVRSWAEKAELKPVGKFGNSNVYLRTDVVKAMEEHSTQASGFRKLGYVHPDQYKALQDLHSETAAESARLLAANENLHSVVVKMEEQQDRALESYEALQLENAQLTEKYNQLQAAFNDLAAGVASE